MVYSHCHGFLQILLGSINSSADDTSGYANDDCHSDIASPLNAAKEGHHICERLIELTVQSTGSLENSMIIS